MTADVHSMSSARAAPARAPRPFASLRATLARARLDRHELAGSLGDLGTFLPLLVGMASRNGLDLATAFFFAGLFNIATGISFAIPMSVQPMKAIAAVALSEGLSVQQILAAGITVSAVVLLLGVTGLIDRLHRIVPRSVVRGLQLALGLSLIVKALQMVAATRTVVGLDSYLTGAVAALIVLIPFFSRRVPAALVLFAVGVTFALLKEPGAGTALGLGVSWPRWSPLELGDFMSAFTKATLPQIPLTTLNSVVAVCALSIDLFPDRPANPRRVAVSVGLMNLIAGWFGGMPMCHGAGGLAGQFRFGARTNGSILFLGAVKMAIGVFLGASLMTVCRAFPASILGAMLVFSGLELALVARDQTSKPDATAMLLTAGACLGLNNIALGFALGLGLTVCLRLPWFRIEDR